MITADKNGHLRGKFRIPRNIPAGAKTVIVQGRATTGTATFTGQGTEITNTYQKTITTNIWRWSSDPLAQTFTLERNCQIAGVDLWFIECGGDVRIHIRETSNGFPNRTVLSEAIVPQEKIRTDGQPTRILLNAPLSLQANEEYSLVVLANDATTALAVAELGKFDSHLQKWVTSQPYTVGTLLSSSNASTWTAHQDRDLTFNLLEAVFTSNSKLVDMGKLKVSSITDLLILGTAQSPTAESRMEYEVILPNEEKSILSAGQPLRLAAPLTGEIAIKSRLSGNTRASPILWPGTQLVAGTVQAKGDYFTRSISAVGAKRALLVYDALLPSGSAVIPFLRKDTNEWEALQIAGATQQGNGLVEYRFISELSSIDEIKVKLELTGNSFARPVVRNIRLLAVM